MKNDDQSSGNPLKITLKPRKSRPFFARHPWVFADSIAKIEGDVKSTDEVALFSHEGAFIARGLLNPASKLRVRLYRWQDAPLDDAFWAERLENALQLRARLPHLHADDNARRLVFSEADGLSGLIVDQLGGWLVCQWTSLALWNRRATFEKVLGDRFTDSGIMRIGEPSTAEKEGFDADAIAPAVVRGTLSLDCELTIRHGGLQYAVNLSGGQKTGFFLDQGENRLRVARYAAGQHVLDLFSYSGGFGLAAATVGQAESVLCVDSSKQAIALAEKNRTINAVSEEKMQCQAQDVAKALKKLQQENRRFGLVICDPPKYARTRENLNDALKAYQKLNENAIAVTQNGGFLASFTCSGIVEPAMFDQALARAAETQGCTLQVVEQLGQPPDHPVSLACPEGRYLYGIIARVLFQ